MSGQRSYRWMAELLDLLFDRFTRDEALVLLRDPDVRREAVDDLSSALVVAGMAPNFLETSEGANLFTAILTLRVKFPREEAVEKMELNIAMREGRA